MKNALFVSFLTFAFHQPAVQACSKLIDEPGIKAEMMEKAQNELYDTQFKIEKKEIVAISVSDFTMRGYGSSLKQAAMCGDFDEFESKVRATLKRGGVSCDAVVTVLMTRGYFNGAVRKEFFYSVEEWPYCLQKK